METSKLTKTDIKILNLSYEVAQKDRDEQLRTTAKKALFIDSFKKSRGVVSAICDKIDISRETYYEWRREDKVFAAALIKAAATLNEEVEDMLMAKIFFEKDGPSIRYWLDRKHPQFKPKNVTEVITGDKTLEDLLDNYQQKDEDIAGQQDADRVTPENQNKEGSASAV